MLQWWIIAPVFSKFARSCRSQMDRAPDGETNTPSQNLMSMQPSHDNVGAASRQLPVCMPPLPDELLSSYINRHAAFYDVSPLTMLQHCLPDASSLRSADIHLTDAELHQLSGAFLLDPKVVAKMTFSATKPSSHRLISTRTSQMCTSCNSIRADPKPIYRTQLMGWRITCPLCETQLQNDTKYKPAPNFHQYTKMALRGEKLLDNEIEFGVQSWTSPTKIAGLLLMRRIPKQLPPERDLLRYRVLGAIIPELDGVIGIKTQDLPTAANPILPLHLRPALLAGIAIVEHEGPEMLRMLHNHMFGENKTRFKHLAEALIDQCGQAQTSSQLHLI